MWHFVTRFRFFHWKYISLNQQVYTYDEETRQKMKGFRKLLFNKNNIVLITMKLFWEKHFINNEFDEK